MNEQPFLLDELQRWGKRAESWERQHREAMNCRDLEDMIAVLLTTLQQLRRRTQEWAPHVEEDGVERARENAAEDAAFYAAWRDVASIVLRTVEACEETGYEVDGADELRKQSRDVSLMSLDPVQAEASIAAIERGEGVPAEEAMDVLRDRLCS